MVICFCRARQSCCLPSGFKLGISSKPFLRWFAGTSPIELKETALSISLREYVTRKFVSTQGLVCQSATGCATQSQDRSPVFPATSRQRSYLHQCTAQVQ